MATRIIASGDAHPVPSHGRPAELLTKGQVERLAGLFEEIALHVERCDRTFYFLQPDGDEQQDLALESIRALTERIGWLADIGCGLTDGTQAREGDPERWMRAPVYTTKKGGAQ